MRRFQALFKIVLVAVVMLAAAGTPTDAKPRQDEVRVVHVQKKKKSFFMTWLKDMRTRLTRYAMAAN